VGIHADQYCLCGVQRSSLALIRADRPGWTA
jgi:hypothetical protein